MDNLDRVPSFPIDRSDDIALHRFGDERMAAVDAELLENGLEISSNLNLRSAPP